MKRAIGLCVLLVSVGCVADADDLDEREAKLFESADDGVDPDELDEAWEPEVDPALRSAEDPRCRR